MTEMLYEFPYIPVTWNYISGSWHGFKPGRFPSCVIEHVTRKSSCVNARGIPTAAYQVLHLLTEVEYLPSCRGTPQVWQGVSEMGYPHWGTPCTSPVQVWWEVPVVGYPIGFPPVQVGGYPRWGTPCWGTPLSGYPMSWSPCPGLVWGYPRWGTPNPPLGYPLLRYPPVRVPPSAYPLSGSSHQCTPPVRLPPTWTWLGYPPLLGVDRQTDGWMNRHMSKHYLPVVLRMRSVKTQKRLRKDWVHHTETSGAELRRKLMLCHVWLLT